MTNSFELIKKYWFQILIAFVMLIAVFIRIETVFLDRQFVFDEAQLACNFLNNKGFLWTFKPLENFQMAPPFFLVLTKILTVFFGMGEKVFKIIPLISSVVSVFVFYFFTKNFLKTKPSLVLANLLFAVNFVLIRFSFEFKQYSTDVLFFMLSFFVLKKISLENLTFKKAFLLGIAFAFLFFISQPTVFVLFGFCLFNIKYLKKLEFLPVFLLPLISIFAYKAFLPADFQNFMQNYWQAGFLSFGNIIVNFKENLFYFTLCAKYLKFLTPFLFAGFLIFVFKAVKNKEKESLIAIYVILGAILASALHFYPFMGRLISYLIPLAIVFVCSFFDFKLPKKWLEILICISLALCAFLFWSKIICKNWANDIANLTKSREVSQILFNEYQTKNVILLPENQMNLFYYYTNILNFKKGNIIVINDREGIQKELNRALKNGGRYWVYFAYDYGEGGVLNATEEFKNSHKSAKIKTLDLCGTSKLYAFDF